MISYDFTSEKKPLLALDFDDTITKTLPSAITVLNYRYNKNVHPKDANEWDFSDHFPTMDKDEEDGLYVNTFEDEMFWDTLELQDGVIDAMKSLQDFFKIIIISKGKETNLKQKAKWIEQNIMSQGINVEFVPLPLHISKGVVFMPKASIMIDDNERYLEESNATIKILFEYFPNKKWNKHWFGGWFNKWDNDTVTELLKLGTLMSGKVVDYE